MQRPSDNQPAAYEDPGEDITQPVEPLSPETVEAAREHGIEFSDWQPTIPERSAASRHLHNACEERANSESAATSRNVVDGEEHFLGCYTFHAVIDPVRVGKPGLTFAAVRVGDHAHVEVLSGLIKRRGPDIDAAYDFVEPSYGEAGWLVLRWPEWVVLRDALDVGSPDVRVIEVENPRPGQAKHALSRGAKS